MQILKELIFIKDWRLTNFSFKSLRTNAQIAVRFRSYSTFHTLKQKPQRTFPILPPVYSLFMCACCVMCAMMLHELKYELGRTEIAARIIINPLAPELFFLILAHSVYKKWKYRNQTS